VEDSRNASVGNGISVGLPDHVFSGLTMSPARLPVPSAGDATHSDDFDFDDEGASRTVVISGTSAAVPEPSSSWLSCTAVALMFLVVRRGGHEAEPGPKHSRTLRLLANLLKGPMLCAVVAFTFVLFAPTPSDGQSFAFTQIYYPQSYATFVTGVNDSNVVVGYYEVGTGNGLNPVYLGFSWQNGNFTTINGPVAGQSTLALAINNAGQVLISQTGFAPTQYFIYSGGSGGTFSPIGLGGVLTANGGTFTLSSITGLNDSGQVVGMANGYAVYGIPAVGPPGTTTPPATRGNYAVFGCPTGTGGVFATGAINDSAQITGHCSSATSTMPATGFIYGGGTTTTFFYPVPITSPSPTPSYNTQGLGINNSGIVSGSYQNTEPSGAVLLPFQGLIYTGSQFTLVVPPGSSGSEATGINNKGIVVGYYLSQVGGDYYGFIAIPAGASRFGTLLGSCGCAVAPNAPPPPPGHLGASLGHGSRVFPVASRPRHKA
jgi:uncharacterized membrane protein